ncbi:MAG: hypothetical protein NTX50_27425 [Candidatus Sumerlaeota bacterium]|nr:hypothetical protein [Candidatus Sumerlaeota bacterium]
MKTNKWIAAVALCAVAINGAVSAETIIRIDAAAPRTPVSPGMYGIFYEEINHAGEGGLYAEMVQNRDFEMNQLPEGASWAGNLLKTPQGWQERKWFSNELHGWTLIRSEGARGAIKQDSAKPLNERNPHSMRLTAREAGKRLGVANGGFWGMNFQAGKWYDLSFYARTESGEKFDLTASLESAIGHESYATAVIKDVGGDWKQYRCALQPKTTDHNGRLAIAIARPGVIWFDVVSLFPRDTFKNRPNGLRADLAQTLADLKPAFVRFPGGAIVGGMMLSNRIQWKNSIGDIAQRKGTANLWGYYTSNGLGYHEYLQLCEDIGASALWVCNPGSSDNYRRAEYAKPEEIPAYVQEALDALEYALGPADSKWGAQRAANGHPAPFPLKYIEIGNEASSRQYQDNYKLFYKAIRPKYPDVVIICNQRIKGGAPVEMVDDHKYGAPDSFFAAHTQYDNADRSGPKVYVGEYGCNRGAGEGNLMAALSEAAYLLGLERNADVVKMVSYAPLFFNVNDIAWPVNMIGFDNHRMAPRSSYYVQKIFSLNRPDETLKTSVESEAGADKPEIFALAGVDKKAGKIVLKVVNRAREPRAVSIQISGAAKIGERAKVTTLGNDDPTVENTVDEPEIVVPAGSEFSGAGEKFTYTFKPHSLTVLRLSLSNS